MGQKRKRENWGDALWLWIPICECSTPRQWHTMEDLNRKYRKLFILDINSIVLLFKEGKMSNVSYIMSVDFHIHPWNWPKFDCCEVFIKYLFESSSTFSIYQSNEGPILSFCLNIWPSRHSPPVNFVLTVLFNQQYDWLLS